MERVVVGWAVVTIVADAVEVRIDLSRVIGYGAVVAGVADAVVVHILLIRVIDAGAVVLLVRDAVEVKVIVREERLWVIVVEIESEIFGQGVDAVECSDEFPVIIYLSEVIISSSEGLVSGIIEFDESDGVVAELSRHDEIHFVNDSYGSDEALVNAVDGEDRVD